MFAKKVSKEFKRREMKEIFLFIIIGFSYSFIAQGNTVVNLETKELEDGTHVNTLFVFHPESKWLSSGCPSGKPGPDCMYLVHRGKT
jgi:hypothetical protein